MHVWEDENKVKLLADKLNKIRIENYLSVHSMALDIGLSEYPLYCLFSYNKATKRTIQLVKEYLKGLKCQN